MRSLLALVGVFAVAATMSIVGHPVLAASPATEFIVVYQDGVRPDEATLALESELGFNHDYVYVTALEGFAAALTTAQATRLQLDPRIAYIAPDGPLATFGSIPLQPGDSAPTGVRRIEAASTDTASLASNVSVAVLDTGIDLTHSDLSVIDGKSCVRSRRSAQDDSGHGTHVAGIIAARNDGAGVVGVAPGTTLVAVKVLDQYGNGSRAQAICGIDWVAANAAGLNIKIANMSFGGTGSSDTDCGRTNHDPLHRAICGGVARGVTFVAAAGNGNHSLATVVPAAYPETLAVTAMSDSDGAPGGLGGAPACVPLETDDAAASFSNFGTASELAHTIAAPGVCILSTWLRGAYAVLSGTSAATPHVSGTIALCFGTVVASGPCSGLAPAGVISEVQSDAAARTGSSSSPYYGFSGDPNSSSSDRYFGYLVAAGMYP